MNLDKATAVFSSYSSRQKAEFLVGLAHALTILGRDTYQVGQDGVANAARLRTLNEVQHRILGFLLALLKDDPKRYPDDVLVRILLEHPQDGELQRQVQREFERLVTQIEAAA
jgi:hypothetical protein